MSDWTAGVEGSCFESHPEDGPGRTCIRPKGHGPIVPDYDPEYVRTSQVSVPLEGVLDVLRRAHTAGEVAWNFDDPEGLAYADGAFDALKFMCGLSNPTERLITLLRSGRPEGDDFPEDEPLGYPIVNRAF